MERYFIWALGMGFGIALSAAPAAAQTHVDIGIWTPNGGGRVVLGSPRVYVPPSRVYVVERGYYRGPRVRGRFVRPAYAYRVDRFDKKREREYRRAVREAQRDYYRDVRRAERYRRW